MRLLHIVNLKFRRMGPGRKERKEEAWCWQPAGTLGHIGTYCDFQGKIMEIERPFTHVLSIKNMGTYSSHMFNSFVAWVSDDPY